MVQYGIANGDEQVLIRQGVEIRRPSEIHVQATRDGQHVTNVRVGGYAVEVLRGTVAIKERGKNGVRRSTSNVEVRATSCPEIVRSRVPAVRGNVRRSASRPSRNRI